MKRTALIFSLLCLTTVVHAEKKQDILMVTSVDDDMFGYQFPIENCVPELDLKRGLINFLYKIQKYRRVVVFDSNKKVCDIFPVIDVPDFSTSNLCPIGWEPLPIIGDFGVTIARKNSKLCQFPGGYNYYQRTEEETLRLK